MQERRWKMSLGRLILRLLLVPLGAVVAICVAEIVVIVANWHAFLAMLRADSRAGDDAIMMLMLAGSAFFLLLSVAAFLMMLPAAIGVAISEAFAIRSWMFHAANGAISAWVGWSMIVDLRKDYHLYNEPTVIVAAGLAAGLAYWLVAGWSAGFWKPVFAGPTIASRASPGAPSA
jgi:hypothetical protein